MGACCTSYDQNIQSNIINYQHLQHQHNSDKIQQQLFTYLSSSKQNIYWKNILSSITNQIIQFNSDHNLLNQQFWIYNFDKFQYLYLNKDQKLQFIQLINNFLKVNYGQNIVDNQIDFCGQSGAKFHKLENTIYFKHKQSLQYFKFIANQAHHTQEDLDELLFSELKFDLSEYEILQVASKVRNFCSNDLNAFVFLSLYLQISVCNKIKIETFGKVEKEYLTRLSTLENEYPANSSDNSALNISVKLQKVNSSYQMEDFIFKQNGVSHLDQLKQFIKKKAEDAKADLHLFEKLFKDTCYSKGYGFKSGLKIKNPNNAVPIFRTIQKLIEDKLNCQQDSSNPKMVGQSDPYLLIINDNLSENKQNNQLNSLKQTLQKTYTIQNLKLLILEEKKLTQLKIQKILNKQKSIAFEAKDLLRGKCTFTTIQDIIETGNNLIAHIKKSGYEVIELKDKLSKHTKDAVLIIKLPKSIAQLQLVLKLDSVSNQFNHKIYQLKRSKLYTPMTNLFVQNQKWGQSFFTEQFELFESMMNIGDEINVDTKFKFKDFKNDVVDFYSIFLQKNQILYKKNDSLKDEEKSVIDKEVNSLIKIIKQNNYTNIDYEKRKFQQKYNEIRFFKDNMDYKKRKELLNNIEMHQLQNDKFLLRQKAEMLKDQNNFDQSLKCYLNCLNLMDKSNKNPNDKNLEYADVLNQIGIVYYNQKNFQKALQNYEKSLNIKIKIKGNQSNDVAKTLNNIGSVYYTQGNYDKAFQNYERCLDIKIKIKGKDSIDVTAILKNMGSLFQEQNNYQKALENYEKTLQIESKIKGKYSLDVSTTLQSMGSVYCKEGNYQKALQNYERCLDIKTKIKGKDSIDVSKILKYIAQVQMREGDNQNALQSYERSLQIIIKIQGKDATNCAQILKELSFIYEKMYNIQRAIQCAKQSYRIYKQQLGQAHHYTNDAYNQLQIVQDML